MVEILEIKLTVGVVGFSNPTILAVGEVGFSNPTNLKRWNLQQNMGLRNRKEFLDQDCFFVTTNCHEHKYLLVDKEIFQILIDNFKFYNKKYNSDLCAYVFMNNHIHFIIYFYEKNRLSDFMRDFKKYTSLKIREFIQDTDLERLSDLKY